MAKLYGVGIGSGDPELMTLKAVRIIKECDVIAVPVSFNNTENSVAYKITVQSVPEISNKEIIGISMPMIKDEQALEIIHKEGATEIINKLNENKNVAFLTLGDPTIFSTFTYIQDILKTKGYETEIVSGIASFLSVAARLNTKLVIKDEELHIIPASFGMEDAKLLNGTKVFMKAGKRLPEIKSAFLNSNSSAFFIENCGMENERVIEGIGNMPDEAGYYSIVVVFE